MCIRPSKWEQYVLDRAQLLLDGWIVTKTGGNNNGISIGSFVSTKGAVIHRRQGRVENQTDVDGRKLWLVDFGRGPEPMRPQQLLLVDGNHEQYEWKLVADSEPAADNETPVEYDDGIGLSGLDFLDMFKAIPDGEGYTFPYLKLLQQLWPGDWKQQLRQLNGKISSNNISNNAGKNQAISQVSEQEWWVFIRVLISAAPQGKGGSKLWEKASHREGFSISQPVNYGPDGNNIMPYYRFNEIKACFPWSFQDKSKPDDPWNMMLLMVDGFNSNRHDWVAASVRKVLDESMSAYRPRTSKTGGCPHLSFILRKPEPLGTEFKTIACTVTGKKGAMVAVCFRYLEVENQKMRILAAVAGPRVISMVFAQHIKPLIFHGHHPANAKLSYNSTQLCYQGTRFDPNFK
jgi:hypothetical protein